MKYENFHGIGLNVGSVCGPEVMPKLRLSIGGSAMILARVFGVGVWRRRWSKYARGLRP